MSMKWIDPVLKTAILNIFSTMQNMTEGGDAYFAKQLALAIKSYLLTATVSTTDSGTVSGSGSYVGKGTGAAGCYVIDNSTLESNLYTVFIKKETTDNEIADGIANAVNTACTASNSISTTTTGTYTPPSGSTVPGYTGTGKGTFTGVKKNIADSLKDVFDDMRDMTEGGDDYFAEELSQSIGDYLRAGTVNVNLDSPLSGSGSGKITIGTQIQIPDNVED